MARAQTLALHLPYHVDGTGRIAVTRDLAVEMAQRVRSIVGTMPGERVMRPFYGSGAGRSVFDVNDEIASAVLRTSVTDAIAAWEPGVVVTSVDVVNHDPMQGTIELHVTYRLVSTGEIQTAVVAVSSTATYGWPI